MTKQARSSGLVAFIGVLCALGCGAPDEAEEGDVPQGPAKPEQVKFDEPSSQYIAPCDDCGGGGGGGGGGGSTTTTLFQSSVSRGGTGAIRDLKVTKGDSASQPTLPGYHRIDVDLNKGAGGTYIYLTFTRDEDSEVGPTDYCGSWIDGPFVTDIFAQDYDFIGASSAKNSCYGATAPPIWEPRDISGWKHPDLNDGAGGRFIFAWQYKNSDMVPIQEVGVLAGGTSGIACPTGWTRVNQDLNEGAGGYWIYFCYRR